MVKVVKCVYYDISKCVYYDNNNNKKTSDYKSKMVLDAKWPINNQIQNIFSS